MLKNSSNILIINSVYLRFIDIYSPDFSTVALFFPKVPSSSPSNITVSAVSSTSIKVTWQDIPVADQNGVILGYLLFYRPFGHYSEQYEVIASNDSNVELFGLKPYTKYSFRLLGYNDKGNGIASELFYVRTQELGKIFVILMPTVYVVKHKSSGLHVSNILYSIFHGQTVFLWKKKVCKFALENRLVKEDFITKAEFY